MRKIVIADDHPFTSAGMAAALGALEGFIVVGVASNGIDAIAAIKRFKPDCAVLDFSMPGASGIDVAVEGQRWSPDTRIAFVTGTSSAATFREMLESGASGLFVKSMNPDDICKGIARVADGHIVICKEAKTVLDCDTGTNSLTLREMEVLRCIARGLSNSATSQHLGISIKTVDSHRTNLMRKLSVNSTATLLVRAMRDGLIDISFEGIQSEDLPSSPKD
ncbi:response regulator [Pseudahrensia aquimaris]|uniref:Response regulator n=1 Tax=Pseudahrensia aquimaris TaxID=744461 RepID=A0ABW3FGP6_9HYPH